MSRRILCIWFPHWPLQRMIVARPELKGRPVVLTEPHPRGGERVVHASRAAYALGVRAGMSVAECGVRNAECGMKKEGISPHSALRTPHSALEAVPADLLADRDVLVQLAYWCHRFSPTVGLEEAERPESLLLDVTGIGRLFGGEECLLEQAARALSARGYRPRLAISDTIGAAWAFAHYATARRGSPGTDRRLVAAVTLDRRSPELPDAADLPVESAPFTPTPDSSPIQGEGGTEDVSHSSLRIPHSAFRIPHSTLPLTALRLPDETIGLLGQLGIHCIDQLAALPREGLESRFGPLLLRRLDQAIGIVDEVIQPVHPPPDLAAEWLFEMPTAEPEVLHAVLEKLLARLTQSLESSGRGASALACRFTLEDGPPLVVDVGLYRPTAAARHLHELVGMQLERVRLRSPVESVIVIVLAAGPLAERQQELFASEPAGSDPLALARWIDRLTSRLGHRGVVRPRLVRDAQPELAVAYEPLVGANIPGHTRATSSRPSRSGKGRGAKQKGTKRADMLAAYRYGREVLFQPLDRPLTLLPRPAPIRVISLLPDGPPAQFVYRGRTHRVVRHWGPERIETGWWRRAGIRRDYWRTETDTGARYWLFRRLRDLAWFLHGVF